MVNAKLHTHVSPRSSRRGFYFVYEGEKDVERAWQHGLSATCNVGGAGKWADELNQFLIGRTVCIVPDNDVAGTNHARIVFIEIGKVIEN